MTHACYRNRKVVSLPIVFYLHGSVAIGYCEADKVVGCVSVPCSRCGRAFQPSPLLYPVAQKDYLENTFIREEWSSLRDRLENAFLFTIFGYSAPRTDVEAVSLLKDAWGKPELGQVEIIDILEEQELTKRWRDFIYSHHYEAPSDFFESLVARHPRRTCEAMFAQLLDAKFVEGNPVPRSESLHELQRWYGSLVEVEAASRETD